MNGALIRKRAGSIECIGKPKRGGRQRSSSRPSLGMAGAGHIMIRTIPLPDDGIARMNARTGRDKYIVLNADRGHGRRAGK